MNILFIGHSLIEFFDWQKRFPEHRVSNLGVAGETVEGLLSRIDNITGQHRLADLIFIMSGINNVAMEDLEFFGAYREIVDKLKNSYPEARICINSLLPARVDFIPDDVIRKANGVLRKLAADAGEEYLDVYKLFIDAQGTPIEDYLLEDGVHLSDNGYKVWADALEDIIDYPGF